MDKRLTCTALAALLAAPLSASAAPRETGEWYVSPRIGYGWADEDRFAGNGHFLGFGLGYFYRENWSIEGELGYNRFDRDIDEGKPLEWRQLSVGAALRYLFDYGDGHPYFGLGAGAARNEVRGSGNDDWGYQIGPIAGFEWDLGDNGAMRFELAHKYSDYDDGASDTGFWDTTAWVGYAMYFGGGDGRSRPQPAPEPAPMPAPAPEPPPAPPEPARPLPVSITLNGVNFDFDKCTLRSDAIAILDEAVRVLNGNEIRVEVAGHTDWIGSDGYNQTLSECRAQVVADYLAGHGVGSAKISAVNGYGESRPIDTNETDAGRARNRRTDLNVQ